MNPIYDSICSAEASLLVIRVVNPPFLVVSIIVDLRMTVLFFWLQGLVCPIPMDGFKGEGRDHLKQNDSTVSIIILYTTNSVYVLFLIYSHDLYCSF